MSGVLTVVDHASNQIPDDVKLGIDPALLTTHIAWDIGCAALAGKLGYPAQLATVSRLVVDYNRDPDAGDVVPLVSDGHALPGNVGARDERIARYWRPYHATLATRIAVERPRLLLSLHSFTPRLADGALRPWEVGVLYDNDDRAARVALPMLAEACSLAGDQLPYSGKVLNYTMNRHGEGTGTPYLGLEVRQDLIGDADGVARWAALLRPVIDACLDQVDADGSKGA